MNELIKALTELAQEATIYLKRANHPMVAAAAPAPTPVEAPKAEPKKAAATKKPAPEKAPDISEEEALEIAFATAKEVAQRFQKSEPDGMTRLRTILTESYGGKNIASLSHEQRLKLTVELKALIAEAA